MGQVSPLLGTIRDTQASPQLKLAACAALAALNEESKLVQQQCLHLGVVETLVAVLAKQTTVGLEGLPEHQVSIRCLSVRTTKSAWTLLLL